MKLKGKIAFLTGGVGGIGTVFACVLLRKGCKVCITDIEEDAGKKLESELKKTYGTDVAFLPCDVTDEKSVEEQFKRAISKFGHVDIMLNTSGFMNESKWEDMINLMLRGTIIATDIAVAHMRQDRGGQGGVIINIASCAGIYPCFTTPIYSAIKTGIVAHTRSWAKIPDRETLGLSFACICPSLLDSPTLDLSPDTCQYFKEACTMLKQIGKIKPELVADGLIKLLQDDDCNGAILHMTRGHRPCRKKILVVDEDALKLV